MKKKPFVSPEMEVIEMDFTIVTQLGVISQYNPEDTPTNPSVLPTPKSGSSQGQDNFE